ncbi:hypothetical protein [Microbacterium lacticum]|uniref:hypothetical protein n=1 Tax=Microbacterium lacticum TaxID=33885 RepID=UPI001142AA44|nr:hypothetical protein [Microbacterium lacticum]GEB95018.1 hypothetical protein MLA01_12370 [Microbacterium lacticum]GGN21135.1 hypothetical protein GCM10009724_14210 [Microbacterium lacticum]
MTPTNEPAIARFRELLQIPTVSRTDESEIQWQPFDDFLAALVRLYPRAHETLSREVVDGHSLLYRWPGARGGEDPLVLMAHLDVVPVVDEEWEHPPFAAEIVGM